VHFTLKKNPMQKGDLQDFITCYNPKIALSANQLGQKATEGRWRKFT